MSDSLHIWIIQPTPHATRYTEIWLLFIRSWNSNESAYGCQQHGILFLLRKLFISRDNRLYWCTWIQWLLQDDGPKSAIVCIPFPSIPRQNSCFMTSLFSFYSSIITLHTELFLWFLSSIGRWTCYSSVHVQKGIVLWIVACVRTLS